MQILSKFNFHIKHLKYPHIKSISIINNFSNFSSQQKQQQTQTKPQQAKPQQTQPQQQSHIQQINQDNQSKLEYIQYENLTEDEKMKRNELKEKEVYWHFGGKQYFNMTREKANYEFLAKSKRISYLNWGYHPNTKMIIPIKRIRSSEDNYLEITKTKNETVVIIQAREDCPEIQLVVDMRYMQRITAKRDGHSNFYYFQLPNGEEIQCLYDRYEEHTYLPTRPVKVFFNRFLYGKPNIVNIPIEITGISKNVYISDVDCEYHQHVYSLRCWVFDDKIPKQIEISGEKSDPFEKILIKDIHDHIPKNLHLHKSMFKIWWDPVFAIIPNNNVFYATREHPLEYCSEFLNTEAEQLSKDTSNGVDLFNNQDKIKKETTNNANLKEKVKKTNKERKKEERKGYIPYTKVPGKVLMATKDKGSDKASVLEYLDKRRANPDKNKKKMNKKKEEKAEDDE